MVPILLSVYLWFVNNAYMRNLFLRGNACGFGVLGAGLVAKPHVEYLLAQGFTVIMASRTVSKAVKIINDHPNGEPVEYNIREDSDLSKLKALMQNLPNSRRPQPEFRKSLLQLYCLLEKSI